MTTDVDDFLSHFGKKGMRWGVRNAKNETSTQTSKKDHHDRNMKILKFGVGLATAGLVIYGRHQFKEMKSQQRTIDAAKAKLAEDKVKQVMRDFGPMVSSQYLKKYPH